MHFKVESATYKIKLISKNSPSLGKFSAFWNVTRNKNWPLNQDFSIYIGSTKYWPAGIVKPVNLSWSVLRITGKHSEKPRRSKAERKALVLSSRSKHSSFTTFTTCWAKNWNFRYTTTKSFCVYRAIQVSPNKKMLTPVGHRKTTRNTTTTRLTSAKTTPASWTEARDHLSRNQQLLNISRPTHRQHYPGCMDRKRLP